MTTVGILGTGIVGRTLAAKIASLGHDVIVGTRDPKQLILRKDPSPRGLPPFSDWFRSVDGVRVETFAECAANGELLMNATLGEATLDALHAAGAGNLAGKTLVDLGNPLDFSQGMPPTLTVANTDSLAEQIQRAFPDARVVKALNTVSAPVMVDPAAVGGGDHDMLICGNDEGAKAGVATILMEWFGWRSVIDIGDVTAARGLEMYVILWARLMMTLGTVGFNVKIVR